MKPLIRFFLSLSFLLLSGYSHLQACQSLVGSTLIKVFKSHEHVSLSPLQKKLEFSVKSIRSRSNDKIETQDTEDEDDEQASLKKHLELRGNLTGLLHTKTPGYLCRPTKQRLPFSAHFPYSSYNRYIVFRVIRI